MTLLEGDEVMKVNGQKSQSLNQNNSPSESVRNVFHCISNDFKVSTLPRFVIYLKCPPLNQQIHCFNVEFTAAISRVEFLHNSNISTPKTRIICLFTRKLCFSKYFKAKLPLEHCTYTWLAFILTITNYIYKCILPAVLEKVFTDVPTKGEKSERCNSI